jgi:hypothetical protein
MILAGAPISLAALCLSLAGAMIAKLPSEFTSYRALRCNVLRGLLGEDYRRMSRRLAECPLFRWFCGMEALAAVRVPGKSILQDYAHWLPVETMRPLIEQLIRAAQTPEGAYGLELANALELERVWLDSSCVKPTFIFRWTGFCCATRCAR